MGFATKSMVTNKMVVFSYRFYMIVSSKSIFYLSFYETMPNECYIMLEDVIRIMMLHVLVLLGSLQKLVDHEEDLILGELVVEPLHQLFNRSEVGFNLLLCVLVHAELHLGGFAAVHEALDLAQVAHGTVVVGGGGSMHSMVH